MPGTDEVTAVLEEETKDALVEAGEAAIEELQGDGLSKDDAIDLLFTVVDGVLAFREVGAVVGTAVGGAAGGAVGSVVGEAAEGISDDLLKKASEKLKDFERDPAKMEERATEAETKGWVKKAARIRKRAERVRARQVRDEG